MKEKVPMYRKTMYLYLLFLNIKAAFMYRKFVYTKSSAHLAIKLRYRLTAKKNAKIFT